MKKFLFWLCFWIWWVSSFVIADTVSVSDESYKSVVQVVAYGDIYGIYPVLRGRWSASIISADGLILTNNHVVSNDQWKPQSAFSICMSLSTNSRPVCNWTASLIAKDAQKDIALLRIDPVDINGDQVNYSTFRVLSLDYDYIPQPQDTTLAIGYPWIGVDTITQTVGVVAGTQLYNEQNYIKTDTLIAPGNSWGPLLHQGKIIGVNTFGLGDSDTLWFALQISEAQEFIAEHKSTKAKVSQLSLKEFQEYLATSDMMSVKRWVSDSLFKISFPKAYTIKSYIKNNQVWWSLQTPDDVNVQEFNIKTVKVPQMKSYNDFVYRLKLSYGYDPEYNKLIKKTIGWLSFYQIIGKDDVSQGDSNPYRLYISQYGENLLLEMLLIVPISDDQTKQGTITKNVDAFIAWMQFVAGYTSQVLNPVQFVLPSLKLYMIDGMDYNIIDVSSAWWSEPFATLQLSQPHERITYTLKYNSVDEGNTQTVAQKFATVTEKIPTNQKAIFRYKGNEWYGYCNKDLGWDGYIETKWGTLVEMGMCRVELYLWETKDYILTIDMIVEKSSLEKKQKEFIPILLKTIIPESIGKGATTFPKTLIQKQSRIFEDAKNQKIAYQQYLNLLVQYGIIKKWVKAWLEDPLTYKEYLALYLKAVYNITKDMSSTILEKAGIRWYYYVDASKVASLDTLIRLRMAGITLPNYTEKTLYEFEILADDKYRDERKKIEDYEYTIFQWQKYSIEKVWIQEYDINYIPYVAWYYDPIAGINKKNIYNMTGSLVTSPLDNFSQDIEKKLIECDSKPLMDTQCVQLYKKVAASQFKADYGSYSILTRWEL